MIKLMSEIMWLSSTGKSSMCDLRQMKSSFPIKYFLIANFIMGTFFMKSFRNLYPPDTARRINFSVILQIKMMSKDGFKRCPRLFLSTSKHIDLSLLQSVQWMSRRTFLVTSPNIPYDFFRIFKHLHWGHVKHV